MEHKRLLSVGSVALLLSLAPAPVLANIIAPSIVDMICAPLPETLGSMLFGAVITVPTLLVISGIEALVVKRLSGLKRFWRVFGWLFVANAVSSFCGLLMEFRSLGSIYPSWWGFLLAYVLTAVVESPLLWVALRRDGFRYRTALRFSFLANAASYAFLVVVVLALTAIPMYRLDPTGLGKELRGQILVYHFRHSLTCVGDLPSCRVDPIATDEQPYTHGFFGSPSGRMFLVDGQFHAYELHRAANRWQVDSQPTPLPGRLLTVGNDGETLVCGISNQVVLISKQGVQQKINAIAGVPVRTALSYDGRYLAYVTGDFDWFDMEAIDASGRPAKGTRGTMPPQFLQDYGDLHVLDVVERSSTYLGRIHGNQFGFHPSKNLLAYISNENIEVLDLDSKARTAIHIDKPIRVISNLAWSPDGKYLVFMQYRGPHFLISRGSGASLWVATPDGSRLVPLPVAFTTSGFHRWNIVWRND